jgi:hypothetical protein
MTGLDQLKFGAYRSRDDGIVWFRTARPLAAGFYHHRSLAGTPPDVCIADSVPALIVAVYPWIREEELEFQDEVSSPSATARDRDRLAERLAEGLVRRLDPDDDAAWLDEPAWLWHVRPAAGA